MKKIVLGSILVLVVGIGIGLFYLVSNLDELVKKGIETYGSQVTQTAVRVDRVKIELQKGSGAINGLTVGNPVGYSTPNAFSLGEISTQVGLSDKIIVIDHITVRAPEIFYEINQAGQNNLNQLNKNIAATSSGSSNNKSPSGNGPEPKIKIGKVLFVDGNIHAKVVPLDKAYELKLPKIEMNNLGGQNGATPQQITNQIVKELSNQAQAAAKKAGIDQYKKQLEAEVNKRIDAEKQKITDEVNKKVGKEVGDKVGDKLKGILNY